jgi:hypothetical protein
MGLFLLDRWFFNPIPAGAAAMEGRKEESKEQKGK